MPDYIYIEQGYGTAIDPSACFHHFCSADTVGNLICCKCRYVLRAVITYYTGYDYD